MKKRMAIAVTALMMAVWLPAAFAHDDGASQRGMNGMMSNKGPMHRGGMMGQGMMGMGMGMHTSMVASGDGGVIVSSGQKLLKYDKDLNLVKQAEIPMDMEGMKKRMQMMQGMMSQMSGSSTDEEGEHDHDHSS